MRLALIGSVVLVVLAAPALGGQDAAVVGATATAQGDGKWRFDVTVAHDDTGWEDYAYAWEVLGPDGTLLGKRVLVHPHVNEQPFTRSLSGVAIPAGITKVTIRAHDNVAGYSGNEFELELPK